MMMTTKGTGNCNCGSGLRPRAAMLLVNAFEGVRDGSGAVSVEALV